jgi:hypothetical protein
VVVAFRIISAHTEEGLLQQPQVREEEGQEKEEYREAQ